jgi:hypothetical protein
MSDAETAWALARAEEAQKVKDKMQRQAVASEEAALAHKRRADLAEAELARAQQVAQRAQGDWVAAAEAAHVAMAIAGRPQRPSRRERKAIMRALDTGNQTEGATPSQPGVVQPPGGAGASTSEASMPSGSAAGQRPGAGAGASMVFDAERHSGPGAADSSTASSSAASSSAAAGDYDSVRRLGLRLKRQWDLTH